MFLYYINKPVYAAVNALLNVSCGTKPPALILRLFFSGFVILFEI